jgi:type II secretory pathway component HofQ
MRTLVLVPLLAACGAGAPRATVAPDDLDLDATLSRRAHDSLMARPPDPAIHVDIVTAPASAADGPQLDIGFRDAEVSEVLRMIASTADFGLVVSDDVRARMTLDIHHVTWRQAVGVIAHLEGLAVTEADGIVLVTRAGR